MKIKRAAPQDTKAKIQAEAKHIMENHEWVYLILGDVRPGDSPEIHGLKTYHIDHDALADLVSDLVLAAYQAGRNEVVNATPRSAVGRILTLVK